MDLLTEVARFRAWAESILPEHRRGEWECDYSWWGDLYSAVLEFVNAVPFGNWKPAEVRAVLFAMARDNELEHLASEVRSSQPKTLVALAWPAIEGGETDAKWQFAKQLGLLGPAGRETEHLLLILVRDENEYVRRRSLESLARLGSSAVEQIALAEWGRSDEHQQWTRMNVLWCLHRVHSLFLASLLETAERDEKPYLSEFAKKIQRGEVDP